MAIQYKYYKSDFEVNVTLKDLNGASVNALNPFKFVFYVGTKSYTCSYDGTTYTGCAVNDDGTITCYIKSHGFGTGHLYVDYYEFSDNDNYESDTKVFSTTLDTAVILWDTPSNDTSSISVSVLPGYVIYTIYQIAVKYGYTGTKEELYQAIVNLPNVKSAITALQSALANKSDVGHTHETSDVNGLDTIIAQLRASIQTNALNINEKQNTLISGSNIKTVNNQSLLGSGNITIGGGGGGSSALDGVTLEDTEEVTDKDLYVYTAQQVDEKVDAVALDVRKLEGEESTITSGAVEGGKIYNVTLTESTDTLAITSIETSVYESVIYLSVGSAVTTPVTLPDTYKSIGTPSFSAGKDYVISILNGIIVCGEVTTKS